MIHKVLPLLEEAGAVALSGQGAVGAEVRAAGMFSRLVESEFRYMAPLIVSEGNFGSLKPDPLARIKQASYSFVIDPLDGALTYSSGYPLWAISVGILSQGKPLAGAIYAPALGELVYCDVDEAAFVSRPFTRNERRRDILSSAPLPPVFINETAGLVPSGAWNPKYCAPIDVYADALRALFTVSGRAMGFASFGYLWDLAGVWPLAKHAGMGIRDLETSKPLCINDFRNDDLRVHSGDYKIMSRYADHEYIKSILSVRKNHW